MNKELFDEVAESLNILGVSIEKNIQNLRKTYRSKWKKLFKEFASEDNDALMKINAAYELLESKKDEDLNEFVKEYLKKTDFNKTKKFATPKNRIKNISNVKGKTEEERIALEKAKAEEERIALEKAKAEEERIALEKAKAKAEEERKNDIAFAYIKKNKERYNENIKAQKRLKTSLENIAKLPLKSNEWKSKLTNKEKEFLKRNPGPNFESHKSFDTRFKNYKSKLKDAENIEPQNNFVKQNKSSDSSLNQNPNDGCVPGLLLLLLGFLGIILISFGILATVEESEEKISKQNNLLNNAKIQNKQNYNNLPPSNLEKLSVINFFGYENEDFIKLNKKGNRYSSGYKLTHFYDSLGNKWNVTANCNKSDPSLTIKRGSFVETTDFRKERDRLIYTNLCNAVTYGDTIYMNDWEAYGSVYKSVQIRNNNETAEILYDCTTNKYVDGFNPVGWIMKPVNGKVRKTYDPYVKMPSLNELSSSLIFTVCSGLPFEENIRDLYKRKTKQSNKINSQSEEYWSSNEWINDWILGWSDREKRIYKTKCINKTFAKRNGDDGICQAAGFWD